MLVSQHNLLMGILLDDHYIEYIATYVVRTRYTILTRVVAPSIPFHICIATIW